ncbi:serine/threonine-protein kinase [Melittangium boletus]|uniref:Protein kinase domain-containing protein n=1 Tax=Melittangium boletus DSM 14713 TaxID=1294270 RepID=A0A250IM07_9BACT|nr:serine/threonine-protein kinase [Melittangium boletus]ATB32779.1 hypothetical protein MEBOL_006268 [Melittangium boletus DSM 14713]
MSRRPRSAGKSSDTFIPPKARHEAVARRLAEGELIAGRYRVLSFVDEGAMGAVYAVEDQSLRERVALKTLHVQGVSAPRMVKRFKRELRLARRVTHPNVCRVFDLGEHTPAAAAGEDASFAFLTMEFLEGETLEAHLRRQGRMTPERILPLAEQMAAALDAAHAARIIHRDFKSGNVMLVPSGSGALRAVVTDFGLARGEGVEDDVSTQEGALLGTLGYMSPEQVECRTLSPASDLYSFGVVLFEMVTGQLPFLGDTPMVMAIKRLFEPPPSPGSRVPGLPASWDAALRRCLARQPEERFPSASRAVEALRGAIPTPRASPPETPSSTPFADMMSSPPPSASRKSSRGTARHEVRGALPTHPEAAHLYAEGLLALRGHESPLAIERLERVVELEPGFAQGHSALAAACKLSFLESRARASARRALELSEGLPREERLWVVARYHDAHAEWAQAIEAYRTLSEFFPGNVEYGTALVSAQVSAGLVREALVSLEALRRFPELEDGDARIDLAAATATMMAGDFPASRRHAEWAVARAQRLGHALIVASALVAWAFAMRNLGESARVLPSLEEAVRLFLSRGERGGAARAITARSIVLIDLGRMRDAEGSLATVVRVARELQNQALEAEALGNAGWLSCHLGDMELALKRSRRTTALYRQLEMRAEEATFVVQTGMVLRRRGDLDEAQRLLEQSRQALNIVFGDEYSEGWASYELGLLFLDRGELATARGWLERTLELRRARDLKPFIAETELALARVALEAGRFEEALSLVERVCAAYAEQRQQTLEGLAQAVRAQVLLAGKEPKRAREALARAQALTRHSEHVLVTSEVSLTEARVALRVGTPEERRAALGTVQALLEQAARGHMGSLQLEARLVRASLERMDGEAEAIAELKKIEAEAGRLGYRVLAGKASAAMKGRVP